MCVYTRKLSSCAFPCVGCKDRRLLISDFATEPNVPLWIKTITNGWRLFWLDTEIAADK